MSRGTQIWKEYPKVIIDPYRFLVSHYKVFSNEECDLDLGGTDHDDGSLLGVIPYDGVDGGVQDWTGTTRYTE